MKVLQVLREWPPGFGGVERVAHELASQWSGDVYSLDVQEQNSNTIDPLPVNYRRIRLPSFNPFGRLFLPLPSSRLWTLIFSGEPLHGHLPSPGVLFILLIARLLRPRRHISVHWHCFLSQNYLSLYSLYQSVAIFSLKFFSLIVTTSPVLAQELRLACPSIRDILLLPCCLSSQQEESLLSVSPISTTSSSPLRVLFIGRLDSYKRLDSLLLSLSELDSSWQLSVVGDGPKRSFFEDLSSQLFPNSDRVTFLGRLSEFHKLAVISQSDLLVLPSSSCHEAFGIVQLEAMASGRCSLAFDKSRSGMGWVGRLSILPWSQSESSLAEVLQRLCDDKHLLNLTGYASRQRYLNLFSRKRWLEKLQSFELHAITSTDCTFTG